MPLDSRHRTFALAIVFGSAAWLLHRQFTGFAPPAACPGVLDAAAVAIAKIAPRASIGAMFASANALLVAPAIVLLVLLLGIATKSWAAVSATAVAIVVQRVLDPSIAPFDPIALAVAATTFIALLTGAGAWAIAGLAVTAAIAPRAALPLALLAAVVAVTPSSAASGSARWVRSAANAAIVLAFALIATLIVPGLPLYASAQPAATCALPLADVASAKTWLSGVRTVIGGGGAYAFGLAALGAFSLVTSATPRSSAPAWVLAAYALLPTLAAEPEQALVRGFSTLLAGFWMSVGVGLVTLVAACRRTIGGRAAAVVFVGLLPLFQLIAARTAFAPPRTYDVERLSSRDLRQLLAVLPDRSVLVADNAVVSTLLRALNGSWQRMGKQLAIAPPDAERLAELRGVRVFAFPSGAPLQWQGVRLTDASIPGVAGLAEIAPGTSCLRARTRWIEADVLTQSRAHALSVVSHAIGEEHGVLVYVEAGSEPHSTTIYPADSDRTGVHADVYHLDNVEQQQDVSRVMQGDAMPPELSAPFTGIVSRIEFWRSPLMPQVVAIDLGLASRHVVIRSTSGSALDLVCAVFAYGARDLKIWQ